ncbi:MAG: hypothetical protein II622_05635, partial [Thermoguttaceae bacterium]|nr:hypothetical protein [Thermoguttaceae bacterium]
PNAGTKLECCDGIFYDANLDCVFIDDSVNNAIWMFKPRDKGQQVRPVVMWMNDDNDGGEGLLDQPCEAVVYAGKVLFVNFDWPFPGMKNKAVDMPGTISAIDYEEVTKFVKMMEAFQTRMGPQGDRPRGPRAQGDRPQGDRPRGPRAQGDRPRGQRPQGDRPQGDRPRGPRGQRPQGDRPQGN